MSETRSTTARLLAEVDALRRENEALRQQLAETAAPAPAATPAPSHDMLQSLIDAIPDFVFVKDFAGRYIHCNEAAAAFFGLPRAAMIGRSDQELHTPEVAARTKTSDESALRAGETVSYEVWAYDPRLQEERLFETRKRAYCGADGQAQGVLGITRDVTQRYRDEQAVREARDRVRLAVEGADLALWYEDVQSGHVEYDERWARMLGYELGELEADISTWQRLVHPDDVERVQAAWQAYLAGEVAYYDVEHRLRTKSGGWKWVLARGRVVARDAAGAPLRVAGTHLDIDESKRALAALRAAQEELEERVRERTAALETANEQLQEEVVQRRRAQEALTAEQRTDAAIAQLSSLILAQESMPLEEIAVLVRAHALTLTESPVGCVGYRERARKQLTCLPLDDGAAKSDDSAVVAEVFAQCCGAAAAEPQPHAGTAHASDGSAFAYLSLPAMIGADCVGRIAVARPGRAYETHDLTTMQRLVRFYSVAVQRKWIQDDAASQRRELARIARRQNLGELSASIAHQLNQPLCAATSNANTALRLCKQAPPSTDELEATLTDLVDDVRFAADVVRRLRAFLREGELKLQELDLRDVIHEIAGFMRTDADNHNAEVHIDLGPQPLRVVGDAIQLQQVVLNLVHNGIEALVDQPDAPRRVELTAQIDAGRVAHLQVRDTGAGLSAEAQATMFEPFFTTKPEGLGMGLAISRSIIEAHQGRLWATTDRPPGTTFHVTIPLGGVEQAR